jgi:NADP-dependent aldehyde dehydrogenase
MDLAASRPVPIPFFAEMSSTNPVFILPGALKERGEGIATGLHASFTLGAGQFCTKPGLVFYPESDGMQQFKDKLRELVLGSAPFHLLTPGIRTSFTSATASRKQRDATLRITESADIASDAAPFVGAVLFETDARKFLLDPHLSSEIFGPATLLVHHSSRDELFRIARGLEGHLTATILGTDSDLREYADLLAVLEEKVGRLIFNGFPTGVEVTHAMVHGGPYPATSDGRSTSVGSQAIFRFVRPICYQGFPNASLPDELKNGNPLGIWRMVDGEVSRDALLPHFTTKAG